MDSWIRLGRRRGSLLITLTAILTIGAALVTPASSEASTYIWNSPNSGTWNNPANWEHVSGPVGAGFPNGSGDVASFTRPFGDAIIVTIPASVAVMVGQVIIDTDHLIHIVSGGAGARLILDSIFFPPEIRVGSVGNVTVPIELRRQSVVIGLRTLSSLSLGSVSEAGGSFGIAKIGVGRLTFGEPCTNTGTTTVGGGTVVLTASAPIIRGDLVIGASTGPAGPPRNAIVQIFGNGDQIADDRKVTVRSDGQLIVRTTIPERIGDLIVNDGVVDFSHPDPGGRLAMRSLTMTGGLLESMQGGQFALEGPVIATSSQNGPALIRLSPSGAAGSLDLVGTVRRFTVNDGVANQDLIIELPIVGTGIAGVLKSGSGTLRFSNPIANTYAGPTLVQQGRLELNGTAIGVPHDMAIGGAVSDAEVAILSSNTIANGAIVNIGPEGLLTAAAPFQHVSQLHLEGGRIAIGGPGSNPKLSIARLFMTGGRITIGGVGRLDLGDQLVATSTVTQPAIIDGPGIVALLPGDHLISTPNGPHAIDLLVEARIMGDNNATLTKDDTGTAQFGGTNGYSGATTVFRGTLSVFGTQPQSPITLSSTLAGIGTVGSVKTADLQPTIAPGLLPNETGRLSTKSITLSNITSLLVDLNGSCVGCFDQLAVTGTVTLANAKLIVNTTEPLTQSVMILANDGTDPINGTFTGLPQGATLPSTGGQLIKISYLGGDGNDIVLAPVVPLNYFLTTSATGAVVDDDIAIANLNANDAPITVTVLQAGGQTAVEHHTVPARTRMTLDVDRLAGPDEAPIAVQVTSDERLPLVVERTSFWDRVDGHTARAVTQPEPQWIFAGGSQSAFDTTLLLTNTNAKPTIATVTFLLKDGRPVVKHVWMDAFTRKTLAASSVPELAGRAFGISVEATQPIFAERSTSFGPLVDGTPTGGHVTSGSLAASTSWAHADGVIGDGVSSFILLSNPQSAAAHVTLRYLFDTGDAITRTTTVGPQQRLTVDLGELARAANIAASTSAAVSTVVEADVPIVSERSTYWAGKNGSFTDGYATAGATATATRWGLAEGRVGGARAFETFLLFANPSSQEAQITVTYLPEGGAPLERTYVVPAASRFSVDVRNVVPELQDAIFGARIDVTNDVPIAVERSMYWNADGVRSGGTNVGATPLP